MTTTIPAEKTPATNTTEPRDRRFDAQDHLRRTQAKLAAERRAAVAAQKAALLQARIDRGVRVRRARQLRTERLAAQKAAEREAAAETAKR